MVKNKIGGKNTKRGARKNMNDSTTVRKLRFINPEIKEEHYGIVSKIIGNGQVHVICDDGKERLCMVRYKFSGRNKSSNLILNGSWVIIGLRSWETTQTNKLEKCDLLEIYSHVEKTKLIQECSTNLSALLKHEQGLHGEDIDDSIQFSNEINNIIDDASSVNANPIEVNHDDDDDDIDFDEI